MRPILTVEEAVAAVIANLESYRKVSGSLDAVVAVLYEAYPRHQVDAEIQRQVRKLTGLPRRSKLPT